VKEPWIEPYKGYILKCRPQETPDGSYRAHLVISYARSGDHEDLVMTPDTPERNTAREAADDALKCGIGWVETRG
jgi:hypothetical protein